MTLENFEKHLDALGFKKLSTGDTENSYKKDIYKRYCSERGWSWVKKIDQENLYILIQAINKNYPNLSRKLEIRITNDQNSFFKKIMFKIPNLVLEIYHNNDRFLKTKNPNLYRKIIFLRKGRAVTVLLTPRSNIIPKPTRIDSKNVKKNIKSYFFRLNYYRIISNFMCTRLIFRTYKYIKGPDKINKLVRHVVRIIWPIVIKSPISELAKRYRLKQLSEKEFLSLRLIDENPLNELIRKPQFDRVTNNGELEKVSDLIKFLKTNKGFSTILTGATEPTEIILEDIPMHLNWHFWNNGDRYFINCILAQFRKNVPPYSELLELKKTRYAVYSMKYYESLEPMTEIEIRKLLANSPISLRKNALSGGRHKMFAMIGRMASGKPYIPFLVDRFL
tara:strand:+ start:1540 stop:2715 length:1176 start_codon:yes stop_codon:yes gene_type:complete